METIAEDYQRGLESYRYAQTGIYLPRGPKILPKVGFEAPPIKWPSWAGGEKAFREIRKKLLEPSAVIRVLLEPPRHFNPFEEPPKIIDYVYNCHLRKYPIGFDNIRSFAVCFHDESDHEVFCKVMNMWRLEPGHQPFPAKESKMEKFPSIDQFRNAIKAVQMKVRYSGKDEDGNPLYDQSRSLPVLPFRGTVKLHGTNAGIVLEDRHIYYQSRERVLSLEDDNAGFMATMVTRHVHDLIDMVRHNYGVGMDSTICIYGEWCGRGIQKGVAISELSKRFVIFAIRIDGIWKDISGLLVNRADDIFHNVTLFPTWDIKIDFNRPELIQNDLIKVTQAVEMECPVGATFGVSGVGEGVVWSCTDPEWGGLMFKVKGEKHSATKVKVLAEVDIEAANTIHEFVDRTVTESRLEQGLHVLQTELLKPFEMTSMGDFIRWIFNDVIKEESDTIAASGIEQKKLGSPIADRARRWYISRLNA